MTAIKSTAVLGGVASPPALHLKDPSRTHGHFLGSFLMGAVHLPPINDNGPFKFKLSFNAPAN